MSEPRPITDADLMAQLRRRSMSPRVNSELSVRDFVTGVGTKIDAGISPVPTRRWPAFAGLAGAAAIVLVLVVALPRVLPGAPSAPPSLVQTPEAPPSTITAMGVMSFAALLATGELNGQKLLILGEVRVEARRGPVCPISQDSLCYVGTLAGSTIDLHARPVATVEGEGSVIPGGESSWTSWRLPAAPTGTGRVMAVSVDSTGVTELLGYTPAEEIASALGEIQYVDFGAMPLDEIRVVPAWLTGIVAPISCVPPGPGTFIAGLPGRYCSNPSWLAPDPIAVEPSGYRIPDDWLQVQSNAYLDFAPDPGGANGSAEPRAGLYVIAKRLEGSGCPNDAPPCWQWEIVGRVTINGDATQAQPLATSSPPTASPQPSGRIIECPIDPESPESDLAPITSLRDDTGLISNCAAFAGMPESMSVGWSDAIVRNSADDQIQVIWRSTFCDRHADVHFVAGASGFEIDVRLTDEYAECEFGAAGYLVLDMSGPVRATDVASSLNRASDVPDPNPPPSPFPRFFECSSAVSMLRDATELVESCGAWTPNPGQSGVFEGSDLSSVRLAWTYLFCHGAPYVQLDEIDGRYEFKLGFVVILPSVLPSCQPVSRTVGIEVRFTRPLDIGLIEATSGYAEPSETPAPTVSPAETPQPVTTVQCAGAPDAPENGAVWMEDHTGWVRACEVTGAEAPDSHELSSATDSPSLTLTWMVGCLSDQQLTRLELWSRPLRTDSGALSAEPFLLVADRLPQTDTSVGCFTATSGRRVTLTLEQPIPAGEVEVLFTSNGDSGDHAEQGPHSIDLAVEASMGVYSEGEPVDVTASITYWGGEEAVPVSGMRVSFVVEQLDGPLSLQPGFTTLACFNQGQLVHAEPRTYSLADSYLVDPGVDNDYTNVYDPDPFILPSGIYYVRVRVGLVLGELCTGDRFDLDASIIVRVE